MSHALTIPVLRLDAERVPFHADPILAAIERHSEAWSVFQVASNGEEAMRAEDEADAALAVGAELLAAVAIIGGGAVLTGLATLL